MRKFIVLATLLSATALGACASNKQIAAGGSAADNRECSERATTGDMYRYCLEVGPQQAILDPERMSHETALALTSD